MQYAYVLVELVQKWSFAQSNELRMPYDLIPGNSGQMKILSPSRQGQIPFFFLRWTVCSSNTVCRSVLLHYVRLLWPLPKWNLLRHCFYYSRGLRSYEWLLIIQIYWIWSSGIVPHCTHAWRVTCFFVIQNIFWIFIFITERFSLILSAIEAAREYMHAKPWKDRILDWSKCRSATSNNRAPIDSNSLSPMHVNARTWDL